MQTYTIQEFLQKFGEVDVRFVSYYKYMFTFTGEYDEGKLTVHVGGDSGDIYRMSVGIEPVKVKRLECLFSAFLEKDGTVMGNILI